MLGAGSWQLPVPPHLLWKLAGETPSTDSQSNLILLCDAFLPNLEEQKGFHLRQGLRGLEEPALVST